MGLRNLRRALCGSLFCIPLTASNAQTILYVNDDASGANTGTSWTDAYNDLHSALAAAQSGDQIWVAAGRYVGNFTLALGVELYGGFAGTETELTQRDWKTYSTILDGNRAGSAVTSASGATSTTRLDGFTITNGSAYSGGGMYLESSSPTIANNTIRGNSASYYGGGLALVESSPMIANNTITDNSGAGLYLDSSSPTIANNMITGNRGGGLILYSSFPTIANNTITGNSVYGYDGGGLYLYYSSPTIANNTITGNIAYYGGGLDLFHSSPTIANNTIMGNSAGFQGGGLSLRSSSPTIANTIIAFNSSGIYQTGSATPTLRYNCIYGNTAYDYSGITDPTGTDGNISADPLFVRNPDPGPDGLWGTADDVGDLRLQGGSPAINAGDPAFVAQPGETDREGHARVLCGRVDMGAYEFGIGDYDCDQSVDLTDFASWSACMTGPSAADTAVPHAPGCEVFDFNADGDVDLLDFGGFQRIFGP